MTSDYILLVCLHDTVRVCIVSGVSNQHHQRVDTPLGDDDILSIKTVAGMTGLPVATLRYYRLNNIGPVSFKLSPRRIAYRRSAVKDWLRAQEAQSARGDAA
jgi:prophage regulatory protein